MENIKDRDLTPCPLLIDEFNERRRKIAEIYNKELSGIDDFTLPITHHSSPVTDFYHVYHQYTIRTSKRDELQAYLKEKGISTMVYYPVPLHKMKVFHGRCKLTGNLAEAERAVREILSLPIEPLLTEEEISYVCEAIREKRC